MATYLELVETQHMSLSGQIPSHWKDRISPVETHCNLSSMYPLMNVNHKRVEVNPPLSSDVGWECLVEQIHKHGLSGSDVAEQV
jgi:hypothetical protein